MGNALSVYLCRLLRHAPEDAGLHMDKHGWVGVQELIDGVDRYSKFHLDRTALETLVSEDEKGRYRFDETHTRSRPLFCITARRPRRQGRSTAAARS